MSGRGKLIVVLLVLLLIVLLAYFLWKRVAAPVQIPVAPVEDIRSGQPAAQPGTLPTISRTSDAGILADIVGTQPAAAPAASTQSAAGLFAASFAERFGSYSNQGNFENIDELKIQMTDAVQRWADGYKQQLRQQHGFDSYYGVETKALSTTVTAQDADGMSATVIVKTQRQEFTGTDAARVFYQDMRLELATQAGEWRVSGVYWQ